MQLDHLSLSELQVLRVKVDEEIEQRRQDVRKEGLEKIKSIAAEYGLTPEEIKLLNAGKSGSAAKRGPVPIKYRDPKNPQNVWTGRGRQPKWVRAHVESGGDLQALVI